ncbi:MAG: hypothetical protein ABR591_10215 [Candidatus Velthaea sp.]
MPIGTVVTFIADDTVDARVRPGAEFRAHLKEPLSMGTVLVAQAGATARLIVTSKNTGKDGVTHYGIALERFAIRGAGDLPVRVQTPIVDHIAAGMEIVATTAGAVADTDGRLRIAIPLPFQLSNDKPQGGYTPVPLRTAAAIAPRATPTPRPLPTERP